MRNEVPFWGGFSRVIGAARFNEGWRWLQACVVARSTNVLRLYLYRTRTEARNESESIRVDTAFDTDWDGLRNNIGIKCRLVLVRLSRSAPASDKFQGPNESRLITSCSRSININASKDHVLVLPSLDTDIRRSHSVINSELRHE